MTGFISLHRDVFSHPLLKDAERFRAWFWLVANAAWKPSRTRIKGDTITLERGDLSYSVRYLADAWGWSKSRVDRFLADLREEGMIETRSKIGTTAGRKAGHGQSIITICNYDKYQDCGDAERDNDDLDSGTTAGQQRDNSGTNKNKGIREKEYSTSGTGRPMAQKPDDVCEGVWQDFQSVRKKKRAPLTETALAGIVREAANAGWSLESALAECSIRGWQAFKAEWVKGKPDPSAGTGGHDASRAAFERRHGGRVMTESEARALMDPAEFERWKARQEAAA